MSQEILTFAFRAITHEMKESQVLLCTVKEKHSSITTPTPTDPYASRQGKPYTCVKYALSRPPTWNNKSRTFVVDPLPLLQFYNTLSTTTPTCDMLVASKVRSYLGLPDLLPPLASLPSANPTQFQKLDHTFTRKQWLSTIHSCRSFANTGYPSDHHPAGTTRSQTRKTLRYPKAPHRQPRRHSKSCF